MVLTLSPQLVKNMLRDSTSESPVSNGLSVSYFLHKFQINLKSRNWIRPIFLPHFFLRILSIFILYHALTFYISIHINLPYSSKKALSVGNV